MNIKIDWKRVLFRGQRRATLEDVLELTNAKYGLFTSSNQNRQCLDTLVTRDQLWTTTLAYRALDLNNQKQQIRMQKLHLKRQNRLGKNLSAGANIRESDLSTELEILQSDIPKLRRGESNEAYLQRCIDSFSNKYCQVKMPRCVSLPHDRLTTAYLKLSDYSSFQTSFTQLKFKILQEMFCNLSIKAVRITRNLLR